MKTFKKLAAFALLGVLLMPATAVFADVPQMPPATHQEQQHNTNKITEDIVNDITNQTLQEIADETIEKDFDAYRNHEPSVENIAIPSDPQIFDIEEIREAIPPNFLSFSGTVTDIKPVLGYDGTPAFQQYYVRLQNPEYGTTIFRTNENTFIMGMLEQGDQMTGFYAADAPHVLIYPPQHLANVIVNKNGDFENVFVDRFFFDQSRVALVSQRNELVLNFTESVPVKTQEGREFEVPEGSALLNELNGRILVVTHGPVAKTTPTATSPSDPTLSITVLREASEDRPEDNTDTELTATPELPPSNGITVNDRLLEETWQHIDSILYVPFRAVVDALGLGDTVVWNGGNQMITVSNGTNTIAFTTNTKHFTVGSEVKTLDQPVILQGGTTYVPWQFFRDVFGADARFSNGQVFVDKEYIIQ